jgi:hypothetical protein
MADAVERIVPSDKFSTRELDYLTKWAQFLIGKKATPIVVDHTRKTPTAQRGKETVPADPIELLYGGRAKSAIADVMVHFTGGLKTGEILATFTKFRGDVPDPVKVRFVSDQGFSIGARGLRTRTPNEQLIIAWFNHHPAALIGTQELLAELNIPERSAKRTLYALVNRGLLEQQMDAKKTGAFYRLAPTDEGPFDRRVGD